MILIGRAANSKTFGRIRFQKFVKMKELCMEVCGAFISTLIGSKIILKPSFGLINRYTGPFSLKCQFDVDMGFPNWT